MLTVVQPVFLTKKQREALALQRRAEEVAGQGAPRAGRDEFGQRVSASSHRPADKNVRVFVWWLGVSATGRCGLDTCQCRLHLADCTLLIIIIRLHNVSMQTALAHTHTQCTQAKERELELEMIKQQYLGDRKKLKKTAGKPSDKFRFNFEWDASEDTSRDLNPLYQNPHGALRRVALFLFIEIGWCPCTRTFTRTPCVYNADTNQCSTQRRRCCLVAACARA